MYRQYQSFLKQYNPNQVFPVGDWFGLFVFSANMNQLTFLIEKAASRLNKVTEEQELKIQRSRELRVFIASTEKQPLVLEHWDEELWITLLKTATVNREGSITFKFKNGTEFEIGH